MQKTIPVIGVPLVAPPSIRVVESLQGTSNIIAEACDPKLRGGLLSRWERVLNEAQSLAYEAMKKRFVNDPKCLAEVSNKGKKRAMFNARFDFLARLNLELPPNPETTEEQRAHRRKENTARKLFKKQTLAAQAVQAAKDKKLAKALKNAQKPLQKPQKIINLPQVRIEPTIRPLMEVEVQPTVSQMSCQDPKRGYNWKSEFNGEVEFQPVVDYTKNQNQYSNTEYSAERWMTPTWPPTQPEYSNYSTTTSSSYNSQFSSSSTSIQPQYQFPTQTPSYSAPPLPVSPPAQFALTAMIQAAHGYPSSLAHQEPEKPKPVEPSPYAQYFSKLAEPPKEPEEEQMRRRLMEIEQQLEEIERQKMESQMAEELRRREMELQQREQWMAMREQELLAREMMNAHAEHFGERGRSRSPERRSHHHDHHHHDRRRSPIPRRSSPPRRSSTNPSRRGGEIAIETRDRLREERDADAARRDGQRGERKKRFGPREGTSHSEQEHRSSRIQEPHIPKKRSRKRGGASPKPEAISDEEY